MSYEAACYTAVEYLARWAEVKAASDALNGLSLCDKLALAEQLEPGTVESLLEEIGPDGWQALAFDREFWLRPKQLALYRFIEAICFACGGRGGGKTRPAAEWVIDRLEKGARVIVMIGPTYDDIEQFMLGGSKKRVDGLNGSGLFDCLPPWLPYEYAKVDGRITFRNGAVIWLHSAELPQYRGPEPDTVWGDELLKWRYGEELLSNLRLACRSVGKLAPQILLTTSPKRIKRLRDLVMDPDVKTIHMVTDENKGNVDSGWAEREHRRLDGTRQGEEELGGELTLDDDSDMFKLSIIDEERVEEDEVPSLDRIVVAVDPAGNTTSKNDPTGISVAGRAGGIYDGEAYVLKDASGRHGWEEWGALVVKLAVDFGASAIVLEDNKFSKSVIANIRQNAASQKLTVQLRPGSTTLEDLVSASGRRIQIREVNARTDKTTRAGPVSTMVNKRRVHHVGTLPELEIEQSDFPNNARSPNRLDALVHALTELFALDSVTKPESGAKLMQGMAEANAKIAAAAPSRGAAWVSVSGGGRWGGGGDRF